MLENLDRHDWASIRTAHGSAVQYPVWLRELASDVDSAWATPEGAYGDSDADSAYLKISETSNHQTSIYEVTPLVTPFLIEILQALPHRASWILILLGYYAQGSQLFGPDNVIFRQSYIGRGLDYDQAVRESAGWVSQTHQLLHDGLDIFSPFLESADEYERLGAALILTVFKNEPNIKSLLTQRLQSETDPLVISALTVG